MYTLRHTQLHKIIFPIKLHFNFTSLKLLLLHFMIFNAWLTPKSVYHHILLIIKTIFHLCITRYIIKATQLFAI